MPLYLLDGNTLTELEDRTKPHYRTIRNRLAMLGPNDRIALSVISAFEFQYGIAKASSDMQEVLAAGLYGELRTRYERETGANDRASGRHTADFLIAATALHNGAILVSSDKIFERFRSLMPPLQIEDWRAE